MITNLFSRFDPSSSFPAPLNWTRALLITVAAIPLFWRVPAKKNVFIVKILTTLHLEFKVLLNNKNINGATILFSALFLFILINNFLGLFPYIFTATSHLTLTLTMALPLWLSFIIFGWINHINDIFAHIVPLGTPGPLIPFIVLIESVSNIIRPITLSVRLIANIIAGHLLITLLGNQTAVAANIVLARLILTQIALLTLERAVAVIQSYVFVVLSTLYRSEVSPH